MGWMWLFSFATALFSIFTGWQLTLGSSYPEGQIFWHKWLGISVAATSFILWGITRYADKPRNLFSSILKIGLIIILSIGGHIGGQLTHGDDYLVEAAPGFVKAIAGYKTIESIDLSTMPVDSINSYTHIIYPLLDQKCVQCHNEKSASGNLDMTSIEKMQEGGDGGEVIIPGDAIESELFRRVTLDQNNVKFMPTKGVPMTYYEMQLLKWWLNGGANFDEKTSETAMSPDIVDGIMKLYNVDFSPRPWYEKEQGPAIDSSNITALSSKGFIVNDMSSSDNFLEVGVAGDKIEDDVDFSALSENIIILDLKNTKFSDQHYANISNLKNLIRLQLNGTDTETEDVVKIKPLPRLESINLYGTQVDDGVLDHLASFPSLKRIYTWQTKITPEGIASFQDRRPDIVVSSGIN
jgi:hypothetical protein